MKLKHVELFEEFEEYDGVPEYGERMPKFNPVVNMAAKEYVEDSLARFEYVDVFKNAGIEIGEDDVPNDEDIEKAIEFYYNNPERIPQNNSFSKYPVDGGDGVARIFGTS